MFDDSIKLTRSRIFSVFLNFSTLMRIKCNIKPSSTISVDITSIFWTLNAFRYIWFIIRRHSPAPNRMMKWILSHFIWIICRVDFFICCSQTKLKQLFRKEAIERPLARAPIHNAKFAPKFTPTDENQVYIIHMLDFLICFCNKLLAWQLLVRKYKHEFGFNYKLYMINTHSVFSSYWVRWIKRFSISEIDKHA